MGQLIHLDGLYIQAKLNSILAASTDSEEVKRAASDLGEEIGKKVVELAVSQSSFMTRDGSSIEGPTLNKGLSAIVTTLGEGETLGAAIAAKLVPNIRGYMNFEGRRGLEALNTPVRDMTLPSPGNRRVETLVIGKSVLATGCTAISLTRTAREYYEPARIFIATLFHSVNGVSELRDAFPEADILVMGRPAEVATDGTLAIGYISELH